MIRTSPRTISSSDGFTLIELLVVVALITLIFLIAIPKLASQFRLSLDSSARDVASVMREAYNGAVMSGNVYRVAFDIKNQQYWVEQGPAGILLDTETSRELDKAHQEYKDPDKKPPPPAFHMDTSITKRKEAFPRGVTLVDVLSEASKEPITEGVAYTHFFPQGISERSVIHLKDSSGHDMSLVILPVLGQTRIANHRVTMEEADDTL